MLRTVTIQVEVNRDGFVMSFWAKLRVCDIENQFLNESRMQKALG